MSVQKRMAGSDELQMSDDLHEGDNTSAERDQSMRPADLRTLIRTRKESERQMNLRLMLLQAIIEGAGIALFSVDTQCRYTIFNKRHAGDMHDLYGSVITAGEKLARFVPVETDAQKILHLIRQALAGEQGTLGDYFGDNARICRYFDLFYYPVRNDAGLITGAAIIATDTTVQKQHEKELSEQEERFRRLAEDMPDLMYRISLPEGGYEYVSPASLTYTGYTPEEFYKKPGLLYKVIHSSGKDAYGRHLELLIQGKTPPAEEFQIVHRNGEVRWVLLRTTIIRNSAGHPIAAEGVATDITDRKKEQIALEETKERFRTIVDAADAGIVLVDTETHVIADANPRALEMIGMPREKVIGADCHGFICPTDTGRCPVTDLGEKVDGSERFVLTADGSNIPVRKTVVPVKISGRDMLIESFVDISEQKKIQTALRENEERYQMFIANSSDGVFRFEAEGDLPVNIPPDKQVELLIERGYLAECNDAMAWMYGYNRSAELIGHKLEKLMDFGDPRVIEFMQKFIRDGYHIRDFETHGHDRTGNTRWFAITMTGVIQKDRILRLWGIQRDITDCKNSEMVLRKSEGQYRELVEHFVDIIVTLTFSEEIVSVSPAVLPLLGYEPDELIGKNILNFLKPESQQRVQEEIDRKKRAARSDTFCELEMRAKDGRYIPFEVNIRIRSEGRESPDIIVTAREIAERKKTEDALRESEERFRSLFQCVPSVAVQGFQPDYTVTYWNEATTRIFGYSADEAMGKDIRTLLIPAESLAEVTGICDRMAATGMCGPSIRQDFLHKDGTRVPVFVSYAGVKIPGKSPALFCIDFDLTERKKTEDALRDAERLLQSILDVAPLGMFVCELRDDKNLVIVSGNLSAGRILMTDCTRFIGKTLEEAFPPLSSTGIPDAFQNIARHGEPFHREAVYYGTEETKGAFEIHAEPLMQNRIIVFFRDISDETKAREDLERSEIQFRTLIRNSPDIIQILDEEKRLIYSSPSFSEILGYPEGSQNNRCILDFVHPDDQEHMASGLAEVYAGTNPGTPTEYRMITADGNFLFVESIGLNLLGVPGVDGLVINTHAVHQRKQAEQALQEREEQFRLIFQYSHDAIYLVEITSSGMPGKIVDANDVAVSQTGYAKDELVQKNLLELCSRDLLQRSRTIMMELLTRGEAQFETEKIKKDGSLLPVEISARLVNLKEKRYLIASSRDISRRKREGRALRIANQKFQLMNIVAWHDIRNLVSDLRSYIKISKDLASDAKLKKFIDSEDDALKVIYLQLQYIKEYQEMGIHPPQWVNLPQVLRRIISIKEMGALKFGMDIPNLELYCDPIIEKVFSHLIENTLKHAKKATEIRISCRETPDGFLLMYEDDGIGIPQEKKKDLFIRGVGSETGFSLFFVHDILEISDMSIQETGEPGKGVRFEISVPKGLYRAVRENT